MRSLHWRLTLLFAISLLLVVAGLMLSAHWHLDYELHQEKWERTHPAQPDWILHGSFTDKEVGDILGELARFWLIVSIPLVALAVGAAYLIARRSTRPIRQINQQVARLSARTLADRIQAPEVDPDVGELVEHFNELLGRLKTSFDYLEDYTSHVAHELRTPLQLMRLRIEANAGSMDPALAEDLQEELARLSTYVETALTIARAEQGRLELHPELIPLRGLLEDALEPFGRLAATEGRHLSWECPETATVWTDRRILRQILVNLLTNALKHGTGEIRLYVRVRQGALRFLIGNHVAARTTPQSGLGIGLRLVRALTEHLPAARLTIRARLLYWVRLSLPTASPEHELPSVRPGRAKELRLDGERAEAPTTAGSALSARGSSASLDTNRSGCKAGL